VLECFQEFEIFFSCICYIIVMLGVGGFFGFFGFFFLFPWERKEEQLQAYHSIVSYLFPFSEVAK